MAGHRINILSLCKNFPQFNCIPYTVQHIPVTYLWYNWKFVPSNIFPLFHPLLTVLTSNILQFVFCVYESVSVLLEIARYYSFTCLSIIPLYLFITSSLSFCLLMSIYIAFLS